MMEFLAFVILCIAVVTLIVAVSLNSKSKKTEQKIDSLHHAVGALHYKVDALQSSSPVNTREHAKASAPINSNAHDHVATQTTQQKSIASPDFAFLAQPHAQPPVSQIQNQPPAPTQAPAQPATQKPAQTTAAHTAMPTPAPAPAPTPALAQQQSVPVQAPMAAPQQHLIQAPQAQPYPYAQAVPARKNTASMEKIIGKNILPFLAAGLVFIGLIFLAILVVPSLTNFQRFIGMFALSGAIFAVGFVLARRKKNIFSVALLGTGIGALFISILMTRIYFNYLGDIPTFALLLVWMIVCMALVKMFNSLTLSITAHVGMAISIIFAFYQGFDQQRALIVVAYQIIATIVIVGGSLLAYRKTYRFGLLASLALTIIATIVIRDQNLAEVSTTVIVTSLLIQFVTASVLSFFLATSSAKLKKEARLGFHYANKAIWIILTILALYPAVLHGMMGALTLDRLPSLNDEQSLLVETIPALVCIAAFVAHALISALLERSIGMPADMVRVSVISTLSAGALMALYQMATTIHYDGSVPIPFLFVFALIALGIARLLHDHIYTIFATILLAAEATIAIAMTYSLSHMPAFVGFIWIAAIMATSVAIYAMWQPAEKRRAFLPILIILNLVFFEVTLPQVVGLADKTFADDWTLSLSIVLLVLAVLRIVNIEALMGMTKGQHVIFAINEYCVALVAVLTVGISGYHATVATQILLWIATVLVIVMSFLRIIQSRNVSALHPQPIQYLSAIMLTLATQAPLFGLIDLGEGSPFVSSVVAMFVALVLVGMGFALRLKPVRLYGLGLTIFAVLKLTTYDVSNISSVGRVIAFIVGGLIAFGISALYNYADKRLNPSRAVNSNPSLRGGNVVADAATSNPQMAYPPMTQAGVPQGVPQPMAGYVPMQNQPVIGQPVAAQPMPAQPSPVQQPAVQQPLPQDAPQEP
ncbi:MAG: DUF2339 domain-containing protein [Actinomycetaceae bacterium]|nr:DUF2339 domain-containing protein [Actinomycetaceae bacterium]